MWTDDSKKQFDSWMKEEKNWMDAEYTSIKYSDTKNADHAHKMRWRCMALAVDSLVEELPPLTDTDCALAIVDRALAGESEGERERRTR